MFCTSKSTCHSELFRQVKQGNRTWKKETLNTNAHKFCLLDSHHFHYGSDGHFSGFNTLCINEEKS